MAHKSWIVTVCCSMSMVSKSWWSHFSSQGSYYATHTLGLNFTKKYWAKSLTLMSVIMHGSYLKRTQLLCVIWWYCLWPACACLSFHRREVSSPNIVKCIHEFVWARVQIWNPFAQFKFSVYGHTQTYTRIKQCSHAVGLAQAHPN